MPDLPRQVMKRLIQSVRLWLLACIPAMVAGCAAQGPRVQLAYFPPPPNPPHVVHLISFQSLSELIPPRLSLLDLLLGPPPGPHVMTPSGIAFLNHHLYLCDTERNVVHDWDLATGQARIVGAGTLSKPVAVAVDEESRLYVADTGTGQVLQFGSDGVLVRRFSSGNGDAKQTDSAYRPTAVAVCGDALYVTDVVSHRVDVFSTHDSARTASIGGVGTGPGQFYYPMGLAIGPDQTLMIADMLNARVQVLDAQHQPLRTMGQPGDRYGDLGKPRQLVVSPDGIIFIADSEFAHVHLFNMQGELLMLLGGPDAAPGATPMPVGLAIARSLPESIARLVPEGFSAGYFLFVTNTVADRPVSLFAVGHSTGR